MATSSVIYTTGVMEKAVPTLSTGASSSGFPIQNAFDFNPDTYWMPSTTAAQTIDIDLGQVQTCDAWALWIHDYDTDYYNVSMELQLQTDDNDNGSYSAVTNRYYYYIDNTVGDPIYFPYYAGTPNPFTTPIAKRYWRLKMLSPHLKLQLSAFMLLKRRTISVGNQWPEHDIVRYESQSVQAAGGREFVRNIGRNAVGQFTRTYLMSGTSDFNALQAAYNDCRGNAHPLILSENSEYTFARFDGDFDPNAIGYQLYNPTVTFKKIPYTVDGESF